MTEDTVFEEGFATMFPLKKDDQPKEDNSLTVLLQNQDMFDKSHGIIKGSNGVEYPFDVIPLVRYIVSNWGINNLVGIQPMTGPVSKIYSLEYKTIKEGSEHEKIVSLNVVDRVVEARSLKLSAGYTIEAAEEMNSFYGLDIKTELTAALGSEIADEIAGEVINDLIRFGHKRETNFDITTNEDIMCTSINVACNEIATATRRGSGNWIIAGVNVLANIISNRAFVKSSGNDKRDSSALRFLGTYDGRVDIYYYKYMISNQMLCGYKGSSDVDVGYIYAPYILTMPSGPVIDQDSFEPKISFMTRYGKMSLHETETETISNEKHKVVTATTELPNNYYNTTTFTELSEEDDGMFCDVVSSLMREINDDDNV